MASEDNCSVKIYLEGILLSIPFGFSCDNNCNCSIVPGGIRSLSSDFDDGD